MIKSWLSDKKFDYDKLRKEIHEQFEKEKVQERLNTEEDLKKLDVLFKTTSGDAFTKTSMNMGMNT